MSSVRTAFISPVQRKAASRWFGQVLRKEIIIPKGDEQTKPLQNQIHDMLLQNNPERITQFENELDTRLFEHRHEPLVLQSHSLPEGVLKEAAERTKIPLGALPNNLSMTFTDNNNLRIYIDNKEYNEKPLSKAKPIVTLSSSNLFHSMAPRLVNTANNQQTEKTSITDDLLNSAP